MKTNRKWMAVLLSLVLFIAAVPVNIASFAASAETSGDFEYIVHEDNTVTITNYIGAGGDVEIPSQIDGHTVDSIDMFTFATSVSMTLTIPETVTSLASEGGGYFTNCPGITAFVVASENPMFSSDDNGVLFNKDKTMLYRYPAANPCIAYTIPNSVTELYSLAFTYSAYIEAIKIPAAVEMMYNSVFSDCYSLTSFVVDSNNSHYFSDDSGVLFDHGQKTLFQYPAGKTDTFYEIPDGVEYIDNSSFSGCQYLQSLRIPDSVSWIRYFVFQDCMALQAIEYPANISYIGW